MHIQKVGAAGCLLLALCFAWNVTLVSQTKPPAIGTITIDRHDIFDTRDSREQGVIATVGNSLHWLTKERVIRDELLYGEGDAYNPAQILETERNLRALGIIGDISTTVDRVNDSLVNITVHTQDKWTLGMSPSYQQGGGVQSYGFTMKDDNFLGSAQRLSLGYNYRSDRDNPHGIESIFSERRLFGTHWASTIQYKNSDMLRLTSLLFEHPYFSDEARWSAAFYTNYSDTRTPYYENTVLMRDNLVAALSAGGYYSYSFGDRMKVRPAIAYLRTKSNGAALRAFDNLDLVNLSLNVMQREYNERVFLNNHGRIEDVPVGFLLNLTVGKNLHFSHISGPEYFFQGNWQHAIGWGDALYGSYSLNASTFFGKSGTRDATVEWAILNYFKPRYDQTLVVRAVETIGFEWSDERQLYLGTSSGLRGYDNFTFGGQRRFVYNAEYRYFSGAQAWIFRPGAALFVDGGTVWGQNDDIRNQRFHHSVGFGFRIENTKQQGAGTIRIDFAYNLDKRKFGGVIISSSVLLSAFQDFGFLSPLTAGIF